MKNTRLLKNLKAALSAVLACVLLVCSVIVPAMFVGNTTASASGNNGYINKKEVYGHWKDTAVMVQGNAAQSFTLMFLQMWNATEKVRDYAPHPLPQREAPAEGIVIPYADSPMDREQAGEMVYLHLLNQAKDHVWIMTPYLILDNEMITAMTFVPVLR